MIAGGKNPVVLGKIVATHGVRGQVRVVSYSGELNNFAALRTVMLKNPPDLLETYSIKTTAQHGKKLLVAFAGIDTINEALPLVGREVIIYREQLPELSPGEYYWCDLLGLQVITVAGEKLGTISDIIATGSNDVYVVTAAEQEYLVPALEDVVLTVDLEQQIMTISPPEGLFDL